MGILDDLLSGLSGAEGVIHPQLANAMQGLMGDGPGALDGIEELLERLRGAGLGGIADTWIGGETNLPISADQLRGALGDETVQAMASRAGLSVDSFLGVLAQHLPGLVDHLSPGGRLLPAGAGGASTTLS